MNAQQIETVHKAVAVWTASMESDSQVDAKAFIETLRIYTLDDPKSPIQIMVGFLNLTTTLLAIIENITGENMRDFLRDTVISLEENSSE